MLQYQILYDMYCMLSPFSSRSTSLPLAVYLYIRARARVCVRVCVCVELGFLASRLKMESNDGEQLQYYRNLFG